MGDIKPLDIDNNLLATLERAAELLIIYFRPAEHVNVPCTGPNPFICFHVGGSYDVHTSRYRAIPINALIQRAVVPNYLIK